MPPATTAGSQKARDIALIRAAYRGDAGWDNTWKIIHQYNTKAKGSPSNFSTFEKTWNEIFGNAKQKPAFEYGDSKTEIHIPLSPEPSQESVHLFNGAIERMVFYEANINFGSSQLLKAKFTECLGSVGDMRYIQTTFLSHAFNTTHELTTRVFRRIWSQAFLSALRVCGWHVKAVLINRSNSNNCIQNDPARPDDTKPFFFSARQTFPKSP
jgi:hypothetical protein